VLSTITGWLTFRAQRSREAEDELLLALEPPVDSERDHVRGSIDAPLTLVEFGDYECGFCARVSGVGEEIRQRFGDQVRYVFRHLPLGDHEHAELAAIAAEAAGKQGRFWDMHDMLFDHQDELEVQDLIGYAHEIGLDVERFVRDLDEDDVAARVRADVASAEESGAQATPTFFIQGRRHTGPQDAHSLIQALQSAQRSRSPA
jgi:protein-disulfide isomerase